MLNHNCISPVSNLLSLRGPAAVARLIPFVVVNSVNRVAATWILTHVLRKVGEVLPSFADGYSSCAVVGKRIAFRVFASLAHTTPNVVYRGFAHAVRFIAAFAPGLGKQAPARLCFAFYYVAGKSLDCISALTSEQPYRTASMTFNFKQPGQSAKCFPGEIMRLHLLTVPQERHAKCMEAQ